MKKSVPNSQLQMTLFPDADNFNKLKIRHKKIAAERLPTNTTTANHQVHRWFNFIAGFSPEFVNNVCRESLSDRRPALLLDPFAGCGTSLLEAAAQGIDAVGYEAHPFFEKICRAKLCGPDTLERLDRIEHAITVGFSSPVRACVLSDTQRAFLEKLFPENVLTQLLGARDALSAYSLENDPLACLILSKTLERSSHSATDGIYKAPTSKKGALSPIESVVSVCDMIRTDLHSIGEIQFSNRTNLFGKSSEVMSELKDGTVSIVVTSPPYLNNFDFAEMTRMQLYFWGMASSWGEITEKVRSRLVVNTTTALKGHKHLQQAYQNEIPSVVHKELQQIVSSLRERRSQKAGRKEYDLLVYPYFAQMTRIFKECFRVTRSGASIHIMIADSALYGIHIKAPQILAQILEEIGFNDVNCKLVRNRGHRWVLEKREGSEEGLGEYHIHSIK